MKNRVLVAVVAAGVLALSACSGSGGTTGPAPASSSALTKVTVGVIPIGCDAAIYLGVKKGFFKDEGLDVTLQSISGGAAAVPSVVSGAYQFAINNVVSMMVAVDKGLDVKFVTSDCATNANATRGFSGVLVAADSPIKRPADLAGKTVSVNTLQNIGDISIRYAVAKDGGDASSIKFVEVPFPDAEAALTNHQVDAIWVGEPFLTSALDAGDRLVIPDIYGDISPKLNIDGIMATGEMIAKNPGLVKKFQEGMKKSQEYANVHPQEVRDIIGTYSKISPQLREKMLLNKFPATFDRAAMKELGDAALKYGVLSKAPNLDAILP